MEFVTVEPLKVFSPLQDVMNNLSVDDGLGLKGQTLLWPVPSTTLMLPVSELSALVTKLGHSTVAHRAWTRVLPVLILVIMFLCSDETI